MSPELLQPLLIVMMIITTLSIAIGLLAFFSWKRALAERDEACEVANDYMSGRRRYISMEEHLKTVREIKEKLNVK